MTKQESQASRKAQTRKSGNTVKRIYSNTLMFFRVEYDAGNGQTFAVGEQAYRTDSSVSAAVLTAWDGLSKIRPANEMCVVSRPAPRDPPPFIALISIT
jgi:hypothetical protein